MAVRARASEKRVMVLLWQTAVERLLALLCQCQKETVGSKAQFPAGVQLNVLTQQETLVTKFQWLHSGLLVRCIVVETLIVDSIFGRVLILVICFPFDLSCCLLLLHALLFLSSTFRDGASAHGQSQVNDNGCAGEVGHFLLLLLLTYLPRLHPSHPPPPPILPITLFPPQPLSPVAWGVSGKPGVGNMLAGNMEPRYEDLLGRRAK